jgi:hypothetical protein
MPKIILILGHNSEEVAAQVYNAYALNNVISWIQNQRDLLDGAILAKMIDRPSWKGTNLIDKMTRLATTDPRMFTLIMCNTWKITAHLPEMYDTFKLNSDVQFIFVRQTTPDSSINANDRAWNTYANTRIENFCTDQNITLTYAPTNADGAMFLPDSLTLSPVVTPGIIEIAILQCGAAI